LARKSSNPWDRQMATIWLVPSIQQGSSPIFSWDRLLQRWQSSTRSPCERFKRFSKIIFDP
jgi:hypothetical protein